MASTTSAGTITAPLPLTTTFTPPSACLTDLWAANITSNIWMNLGPVDTAVCLPSGWSPSQTFSPGVCPSGWHVASNITTRVSNEAVTIGTCCPQYSIRKSNWVFSTRSLTDPQPEHDINEICWWSPTTNVDYIYTYLADGMTSSVAGSMTPGGWWNAYGIMVAWQSNDQTPATVTATTTSSISSTSFSTFYPTSAPTSSPISSPTSTPPAADTSSGLSSGVKAGIGIGVALGVILALSALGFLIWQRRRRRRRQTTQYSPAETKWSQNVELSSTGLTEAPSNHLREAHSSVHEPVELDDTHR